MEATPLPWSSEPFGDALRAALTARGMSFRDLESRCLVPVGNLHDHVSGKRTPPGDDLLRRIAEMVLKRQKLRIIKYSSQKKLKRA